MVTHFNKAVTDTTAELPGKQRRKKALGYLRSLTFVKKRGEPEEAKDYRDIKRKIRTEMKMAKRDLDKGQCQEGEACLRKNNSKKAYQLVKDLTTEEQGKVKR